MDNMKLQEELAKFKESLSEKTLEELTTLEQEIIKKAEELDKKVASTKFDLPKKNYKEVATAIQSLLNKQVLPWQGALSMISLVELWDPDKKPEKIAYPEIDATLRTLGGMQYQGYEEWAKVAAINKYIEPLRDSYGDLTLQVYDVASRHNFVMDEMQLKTPIPSKEVEKLG